MRENISLIFGEQYFKLSKAKNRTDVVVVINPIPLYMLHNEHIKDNPLSDTWKKSAIEAFNSLDNVNYLLNRTIHFGTKRSNTTEEDNTYTEIKKNLDKNSIKYKEIFTIPSYGDRIVNDILYNLNKLKLRIKT